VEEHHNMSYKKYGKFDREEYMLEDDFLELDGDFLEMNQKDHHKGRDHQDHQC
jgi:hypothetical protein